MRILTSEVTPDEARTRAIGLLMDGGATFPEAMKDVKKVEEFVRAGETFHGVELPVKDAGDFMLLVQRGTRKES